MAGTLTVAGMAASLASGQKTIGPITATGSATIGTITDVALSSGDNSVTVPSGAVMALVVFPSGLSTTVKIRTNLDSSGVTVGLSGSATASPFVAFPIVSGVTSLVLNAGGAQSLITEVTFI